MSPKEKSREALKKQLRKLREEIARLNTLYYQQARPAMADMEYDFLKKELESLEQANPEIAAELDKKSLSPTARVGSELTGELPTVRHRKPMLSLDNSYSREELEDFDSRLRRALKAEQATGGKNALSYVVEPKIDGLSINVLYENGKLVRALTRGDGEEGEDVTQNFLTIAGVPQSWPAGVNAPKVIELRGEVYLTYEQFQKINADRAAAGEEEYANPRNLAAGSLKLKTTPEGGESEKELAKLAENLQEVKSRGLRTLFYATGDTQPADGEKGFTTHLQFLEFLKANGFPTQAKWWVCQDITEAWAAIEELDKLRKSFAYPTDGAVVKLNDFALREVAGMTARSPRWAFAYKYLPERAEALLRKITIQVGRTGVLTPVAELEDPNPEGKGKGVELSGSVVARATLHNADEIARKDVREGDTVIIEKAGEVIPAVVSVVLEKRPANSPPFKFPSTCPECGNGIVKMEGEVALRCVNEDCKGRLKQSLEHFAGRNAMAIDGLGETVVEQLVEGGLVKTAAELYALTREKLLHTEYFQNKVKGVATGRLNEISSDNLLKAIEDSKQNALWRLLHGLGIPQVGETVSQTLAAEFGSLAAVQQATAGRLVEVSGIGANMAEAIVKFFANPRNAATVEALTPAGLNTVAHPGEIKKQVDGPLSGKKFVLTGELKNFTRSQAKARLEALGGKVVDKVSKGVEALIVGEAPGSKLAEARKLGVKVLEEGEFEQLISGQ